MTASRDGVTVLIWLNMIEDRFVAATDFGYHNVWAADISNDGRYLLMMTSQSRLTKRPTTLFSLYRLDMQTLQAELLIDKDGFISGARFSPDGTQVLVSGSPESLGGIGKM